MGLILRGGKLSDGTTVVELLDVAYCAKHIAQIAVRALLQSEGPDEAVELLERLSRDDPVTGDEIDGYTLAAQAIRDIVAELCGP